jgi:hypothetical protein
VFDSDRPEAIRRALDDQDRSRRERSIQEKSSSPSSGGEGEETKK